LQDHEAEHFSREADGKYIVCIFLGPYTVKAAAGAGAPFSGVVAVDIGMGYGVTTGAAAPSCNQVAPHKERPASRVWCMGTGHPPPAPPTAPPPPPRGDVRIV
jgi:hypothetical protein